MANSFKDALIKAGVVKKDDLDREKEKVRRENIQNKGPSQQGIHAHHIRTDCGACGKGAPDVEYYEHTNRSVEAKWLCIPCADKLCVKDECRQTNQSSYSKAGTFRRFFGMTKRFPAGSNFATPGAQQAQPPKGAAPQQKNVGSSPSHSGGQKGPAPTRPPIPQKMGDSQNAGAGSGHNATSGAPARPNQQPANQQPSPQQQQEQNPQAVRAAANAAAAAAAKAAERAAMNIPGRVLTPKRKPHQR